MKISDYSVQKLGEFIAGDLNGWPYRKGTELIDFSIDMDFGKFMVRGFQQEGFTHKKK